MVESVCQNCGKTFLTYKCRIKSGKAKNCSKLCFGENQSRRLKGNKPSYWKNTGRTQFKKGLIPWNYQGIEKQCIVCSKSFSVSPCRPNAKYCSYLCRNTHYKELFKNHKPPSPSKGSKHPNWKGGPKRYPYDFNKELKELIRKRDLYKCQLCGCPQEENITLLSVHHIDYDVRNINPTNLITLCKKCHAKTNYNREVYKEMLTKVVMK